MSLSKQTIVMAFALSVLAGCAKHEIAPEPVRPVQLTEVTLGALAETAGFAGEVKPRHEMDLGFRIGGKLVARSVDVGARVRKGDILCVVDTEEDVLKYMSRFIQYYRENAKYLERSHGFVQRLGIDRIRAVVVDDSEGIASRLEAEIAASKAAYKDPWKEAYMHAPNQFASELRVIS